MKIAMIGTGYVGLVTGTCFAETGNDVVCIDIDADKIARLSHGEIPIYEPGLSELVLRNATAGRLTFTTECKRAVASAKCVFVAVGTPQREDGSANLSGLWSVVEAMAPELAPGAIVVIKSTVPVGTNRLVAERLRNSAAGKSMSPRTPNSSRREPRSTISPSPIASSSVLPGPRSRTHFVSFISLTCGRKIRFWSWASKAPK